MTQFAPLIYDAGLRTERCHGVERSIWALMVIFIKPLIDYASGLATES